MATSEATGSDILIVSHKLAAFGDNTVCAAHKICDMLLQNGGKVFFTTTTREKDFAAASIERQEMKSLSLSSSLHMIHPTEGKAEKRTEQPNVSWISFLHKSFYHSFGDDDERLDNVGFIIGFEPTTAGTAIEIQQQIQYKAKAYRKKDINLPKVVLINCSRISEDHHLLVRDVEDRARKADVIFSVGTKLHDHFEGLYSMSRDPSSISRKHRVFLFRPSTALLEEQWSKPPGEKLASFWNKGTYSPDLSATLLEESMITDYQSACKAIGYLASDAKLRGRKPPEWLIPGLGITAAEQEVVDALKFKLEGSESFKSTPRPDQIDLQSLLRVFRTHAAILAPEYESDGFNFQAWEAAGFGIPTFVSSQSSIAELIKKVNSLMNYHAVVALVRDFTLDVESWKSHIARGLSDSVAWASRLREDIIRSPVLIQSEQSFVQYFGLCLQSDYRRVCVAEAHAGHQETTPDPRVTVGDELAQPEPVQTRVSPERNLPSRTSGQILRVCVDLRKVEPFGASSDSCVRGPARMRHAAGGDAGIDANEHLANCMQRHLEDNWMGTPDKVKEYWKALLDAMEAEEYSLFSSDYNGYAIWCVYDSDGAGFSSFSEPVKNALINYVTLLGIDANEVEVSPHEGSSTASAMDVSTLASSVAGMSVSEPGTDLLLTEAQSMTRVQGTPPNGRFMQETSTGASAALCSPSNIMSHLQSAQNLNSMQEQASRDDGTNAAPSQRSEPLPENWTVEYSQTGVTAQGDNNGRPHTPIAQQVQEELETQVKERHESVPTGGKLAKLPQHNPARVRDWFTWQNFSKVRACTKLFVDSAALKSSLKPVVVAVIDTGVFERDPELVDYVIIDRSKCFVNDAESKADLRVDRANHGTMVAGIVALYGPVNVKIINLKVQPAPSVRALGDMRDLVEALKFVKDLDDTPDKVDIVNMSMGQPDIPPNLSETINKLADSKVLLASAGNFGARSTNTIVYPAMHPNVICVGACDYMGHMTGMTSQGSEVDFLCPGEHVVSTSTTQMLSGTSFASPHAAAVSAHVLVALQALAATDPRFAGLIQSAPLKVTSTAFMRNFLIQMCTGSTNRDSDKGGHGVLKAWENGFRNTELLKDYCKIALAGQYRYFEA